jgi:gluconokinase
MVKKMTAQRLLKVLIFIGVCGSGKSTVGKHVAEKLGIQFAEGDSFHSEANVEKMRSGTPLNDEDREPWLAVMADTISEWVETGKGGVLSCSALKRKYRDRLRGDYGVGGPIYLIYLNGPLELIEGRMNQRESHYMPAGLLTSQFATMEEPHREELAINIDILSPPDMLATQILIRLGEG